ncbi:CASP-like protein 4C1 [Sorghum bicolor]|uniref:CASP-like protein n=1 Tax=Sorghum bicolor TaxID=4558 RepID=C5YPY0_SORBI|nr:CASP-like protein 4C1 [Sorghum bicolor]EES16184.1 hypothetical protein SORBI_3008G135100 [Sorghum bicolor]|eukprot:XP_002442346.1 CASP-like protein 4C1 [Sorghum bicolor]
MPQQNGGGWAVEAQQQATTTKQPARRGRPGEVVVLLLLLLRVGALCAAAASAALAASSATATLRRAPFRFLLAADAIVAVYSAFEAAAAAWEVARGATLLPEAMQLWFDFGHDQGFGYMALAAAAAAARDAAWCGGGGREGWMTTGSAACVRADVAVGLGFAGFAFLALAALVTGFRVACFLATGSRFPPPASY